MSQRIRAFWKHRQDPSMRQANVIENVPHYGMGSRFPWVHLLTQACISTQSVWTWANLFNSLGHIVIQSPFTGGHRTIRSVHFALSRSLPRSLSRGIKLLKLAVHFRRFQDLTHIVCELLTNSEKSWTCLFSARLRWFH